MTEQPSFDFNALDDLGFAAERGRLVGRAPPPMTARHLGPVIELAQLSRGRLLPRPDKAEWLTLDGLAVLCRALASGRPQWVCPDQRRMGFLRMQMEPPEETVWTSFCFAAQRAALMAGFPKPTAQQLAAAIGELHSNVYEHSGRPDTGLIAFRAGNGAFEFAVADAGIGILDSLRTCGEYAELADHGTALKLALTPGVSRHGSNAQRGYGFRPIFVGLANIRGYLRFRSGDHALTMDGTTASLMQARPAQKPAISGFLISIMCQV
jgi:hypothetical protein